MGRWIGRVSFAALVLLVVWLGARNLQEQHDSRSRDRDSAAQITALAEQVKALGGTPVVITIPAAPTTTTTVRPTEPKGPRITATTVRRAPSTTTVRSSSTTSTTAASAATPTTPPPASTTTTTRPTTTTTTTAPCRGVLVAGTCIGG